MQDFTNGTLDLDLLPKYEEISLHPVSSKYWKIVLLNIVIFLVFLAIALTALLFFSNTSGRPAYLAAGGYVLFGILLVLFYRASVKKRGFALREKDLIYKSGIIVITTAIIPFHRIQHITLNEGIFSRMFQLGAIHIYSAGGASGSITIAGLDIEQAKTIKEELTRQLTPTD